MGVLRTQFTWIIFIAKNKQTRDRDKDRFYVQFYWLGATTINIGFTNQDPSCRAGSHKSSGVFLTILLLHYPEPGCEWWSLQRAVSCSPHWYNCQGGGVMSPAESWDEPSCVGDNVNKSNWDAKWIHTTNVDEWWISLIGRTLGLNLFSLW